MKGRRPKRYGPVRNRGVWVPQRKPEKTPKAVLWYVVPAGTDCDVRRLRTKPWRRHTTKREIVCHGFLWRNQTHYGLAQGEYEVRVSVKDFQAHKEKPAETPLPPPEQGAENELERLYRENEAMANDCFWRGAVLQTKKTRECGVPKTAQRVDEVAGT